MENFFVLLSLAAMICLIIGLIKPSAFKALFKERTSRKTTSITFGIALLVSFILVGVTAEPLTAEQKAKLEAEAAQKEKKDAEASQAAESEAAKNSEPSTEEKLKSIVGEVLDGKTNNDRPDLRDVTVLLDSNAAVVLVSFNADDNLTSNMIQVGIRMKMSDLYYKLYQSGVPIKSITISAYLPLTDKYGNESESIVCTTVLKNEEAVKVNWKADESTVKSMVLPQVWYTSYLHPAIAAE